MLARWGRCVAVKGIIWRLSLPMGRPDEPREAAGTRETVLPIFSMETDVVDTPSSEKMPSWPTRPGTKGVSSMALVSDTTLNASLLKMSMCMFVLLTGDAD